MVIPSPVETVAMKGTGKLTLTGQLGDVMQESAKIAFRIYGELMLRYMELTGRFL